MIDTAVGIGTDGAGVAGAAAVTHDAATTTKTRIDIPRTPLNLRREQRFQVVL